jgi:hypothetical protein
MQAFVMGEANRGKEMMIFDWGTDTKWSESAREILNRGMIKLTNL